MPPVNINTIKEWFRTLKKPTEDQFHAWLDSFRHKLEKVPLEDVEGLQKVLLDKADLVGGVVPEHQLPFTVKTSEVLAIGKITATSSTVKVAVHESGKNRVRLNGAIYERAFENNFTYTAVVNYIKILIIYALPEAGLFFLAEGIEAAQAVEPPLPDGALVIRKITVYTTGQIVESEPATGLKYAEEDGWRNIRLSETLTVLPYSYDLRSSYWIDTVVGNPVIGGIQNGLIDRNASPSWDGKEFWIYNNTGTDLKLDSSGVEGVDVFLFGGNNIPLTLKAKQSCKIKLHENVLEIIGVMSSGSALPVAASNGLVLESDSTQPGGVKWGTKIKGVADKMLHYWDAGGNWVSSGVEFAGNAILKLKIITFGGYTIAQKTAIVSPTEGMLIYQNESPKGFQKYENGAWTAVGSNLSNTDLSNVSARSFTQGNTFTWNTAGFFHYLKGLIDKTGNAAYTKVVVLHPSTGEMVTRDFADPAATTLAVQNANSSQKTAMRTALLGASVPANPVLSDTAPRFVTKGIIMFDLYGLNLTLLDPTFIWIEKTDGTKIYATNFYNLTNNAVTTQWNLPSDLPLGDYDIRIQNGVTVQGLSTAKITVVNSISPINLLGSSWKRKLRKLTNGSEATYSGSTNTVSDNMVMTRGADIVGFDAANPDTIPAIIYKSENIFLGSKDWDIEIKIKTITQSGFTDSNGYPYIGFTETTHTDFVDILSLIYSFNTFEFSRLLKPSIASSSIDTGNNGGEVTIYLSKVNEKLFVRFCYTNILTGMVYYQTTIDTSKNYALFFRDSYHPAFHQKQNFITARIMN